MAKLQPVVKSEIYLTDVAIVAGKARYHWSSYIYDDPNTDMKVAVTGFLTPTNNINNAQITNVSLGSQWFEVTHTTELAETAIALARAGTTTNATCKNITRPLRNSNLVLSNNQVGCNFHQRNPSHGKPQGDATPAWTTYMKKPIAYLNRRLTAGAARYWKDVLSPTDRALWDAAAAAANWTAYNGTTFMPTGAQLWIAAQRFARYYAFWPSTESGNLFTPTEILHGNTFQFPNLAVPSPFQPYSAPGISNVQVFDGTEVFFDIAGDPDPFNCDLITEVALHFNPGTNRNPKKYRATYHSYVPYGDGTGICSIYIDYPKKPGTPAHAVRIGLRWYNFITNQISFPSWIIAVS